MLNPYKFRGKLEFDIKDPQDYSIHDIQNILFEHFINIGADNLSFNGSRLTFSTHTSLLSLEHHSEIRIIAGPQNTIEYVFNYGEIYKIILMVLLFALFFITFSWWIYIVVALFFTIAVVTVNIHYVNTFIKQNIIGALGPYVDIGDSYISNTQKEWIKNPLKCSACGSDITKYNTVCHNCGLQIQGRRITSSMNTSLDNVSVNYELKPSKNEKNSS